MVICGSHFDWLFIYCRSHFDYLFVFYRSGSSLVKDIDEIKGNTGIQGDYCFRIERSQGDDSDAKCRKWLKWQEENLNSQIMIADKVLTNCPCSKEQAEADVRFNHHSVHELSTCYQTFIDFNINITISNITNANVNRRCCYDSADGFLLVEFAVDSGRIMVNFSTPPNNIVSDETAEDICCDKFDQCVKFYEARPSDDCQGYEPLVGSK